MLEIKLISIFTWKIQKAYPKYKISYPHISYTNTQDDKMLPVYIVAQHTEVAKTESSEYMVLYNYCKK